MWNRFFKIAFVSTIGIALFVHPTLAETNPAEKAIQGVKNTVEALIEAKDKNDPKEAGARLEAYQKVLGLMLQDAKEMRIKLLSFEEGKTTTTVGIWKKNRVEALLEASKYYEKEILVVKEFENPPIEEVKTRAEDLKKWREEVYIPLAEEIQAFLLIEQQKKSIATAEGRLEKVNVDVLKLKKAKFKKIKEVEEKFLRAGTLISEAKTIWGKASREFEKRHLLLFMKEGSLEREVLEKEIKEEKEKIEKEKKIQNTTQSTTPPSSPPSIKEMVDESFAKVKDSYQLFIEMSNFVRKLL